MSIYKESTPPPKIGKIGPYTVFVTPSPTPRPVETVTESPKETGPRSSTPVQLPPVQPPPVQFDKSAGVIHSTSRVYSGLGFFWNAVEKVQNAHSSLDHYVAHLFGLNQSKYQWALDDYYESKGFDQMGEKATDTCSKMQGV